VKVAARVNQDFPGSRRGKTEVKKRKNRGAKILAKFHRGGGAGGGRGWSNVRHR